MPAPVADRGGARLAAALPAHVRALKHTQLLVTISEGATRRAAPQPHLRTELTVRLSSSVGWAALACSSTSWSCSDIILYTVLYLELVLDVGLGFPLPATRLLIQRGSDDGVAARGSLGTLKH